MAKKAHVKVNEQQLNELCGRAVDRGLHAGYAWVLAIVAEYGFEHAVKHNAGHWLEGVSEGDIPPLDGVAVLNASQRDCVRKCYFEGFDEGSQNAERIIRNLHKGKSGKAQDCRYSIYF
jgi:hypothetical protein